MPGHGGYAVGNRCQWRTDPQDLQDAVEHRPALAPGPSTTIHPPYHRANQLLSSRPLFIRRIQHLILPTLPDAASHPVVRQRAAVFQPTDIQDVLG